jgi:23S rRNA (adenine2503-C2)-methyltransferase
MENLSTALSAELPVKENLKGLTEKELEAKMVSLGQSAFRGRQLFRWMYGARASDFSAMTDLSKSFREFLKERFYIPHIEVVETRTSQDGTVKYVVQLPDGEKVESVFIPTEDRNTLCVSTQVGCKMACSFCATGYQKFTRDLKSWEILDQLLTIPTPGPISNIVMMGMGEPFDNFEQVVRALEIMQHPAGPAIGKRHITVSTVGLVPKMQMFLDRHLGKLAISLHGTTDEQRSAIMPINRKYPLKVLMDTCRDLTFRNRDRVTFEYILIKDFNDTKEDAHRLVKLVQGIPCKINLLAYNENPYVPYKRPDEDVVLAFQSILLAHNLTATYRRSRGRDIAAACGQLITEVKKKAVREL